MADAQTIRPVILCGGAGTRLWPLSRIDRPKPFVSLDGEKTLFEQTLDRVRDRAVFAAPLVVVSEEFGGLVAEQLDRSGITERQIVLEPCARGTAPAIALAALEAAGDDLLLVLPSDHVIGNPAAFHAALELAIPAARMGWLVTFGIVPDRPETGYGYIQRGKENGFGGFEVERFVEKPDAALAAQYLATGGYSWNAGIFLFSAATLLAELTGHASYILPAIAASRAAARRDGDFLIPDPSSFARVPAQSIDHAVMEKSRQVAVVPVDMAWSDIGSWEALHAVSVRDERENATSGNVVLIDSDGSFARSDGPLVVGIGVRDLVVVATERSVLIVPRGDSQRVREAVDELVRRGGTPPDPSLLEEKTWK